MSVALHGRAAQEGNVNIDTTAQEKNITYPTYPTDAKLAIKIINRLNKLAKFHGILQRRTCVKEINLLMAATAWNLRKWLTAFFWWLFLVRKAVLK
jgi:IS5 family transposase